MKTSAGRGLAAAIALLVVLAVPAAPAYAALTEAFSDLFQGRATDAELIETVIARCPASNILGSITPDGRSATVTLNFSDPDLTCVENVLGTSVDIRCAGTVTFVVQASVAGTSASGDLQLDNNYTCTIDTLLSDRTIRGPQTIRACWTYQQATSILGLNCAGIRTSTGTSSLSATYAMGFFLTVS